VTQKVQGHDPNIFGPDDGWRYGISANGAPIGNDYRELNGHVNDDVT